jgi:hypothetical protein
LHGITGGFIEYMVVQPCTTMGLHPDVVNNPGNDSQMTDVFHLYVRDGLALVQFFCTSISLKITPGGYNLPNVGSDNIDPTTYHRPTAAVLTV